MARGGQQGGGDQRVLSALANIQRVVMQIQSQISSLAQPDDASMVPDQQFYAPTQTMPMGYSSPSYPTQSYPYPMAPVPAVPYGYASPAAPYGYGAPSMYQYPAAGAPQASAALPEGYDVLGQGLFERATNAGYGAADWLSSHLPGADGDDGEWW